MILPYPVGSDERLTRIRQATRCHTRPQRRGTSERTRGRSRSSRPTPPPRLPRFASRGEARLSNLALPTSMPYFYGACHNPRVAGSREFTNKSPARARTSTTRSHVRAAAGRWRRALAFIRVIATSRAAPRARGCVNARGELLPTAARASRGNRRIDRDSKRESGDRAIASCKHYVNAPDFGNSFAWCSS